MKKLLIAALLSTGFVANIQVAHANDQIAESLCGYIEADSKSRLRKVLKENNLRIRNIFGSIACDGQDMLRFAVSSEANKVGGFILSKLPVKLLTEPGPDGKTFDQWAQELGHAGSPVVQSAQDKVSG